MITYKDLITARMGIAELMSACASKPFGFRAAEGLLLAAKEAALE